MTDRPDSAADGLPCSLHQDDLQQLARERDAADRYRADAQLDRDQHAAVLAEILEKFERAWPGPDQALRYQATVTPEDHERWRSVVAPTVEAPWWQQLAEQRTRAEQAEDLLRIAYDTSNRSEVERARAVQRADQAEAEVQRLLRESPWLRATDEDRQAAEGALARVRALIADQPVTARSGFGDGYREALRDITAALAGPPPATETGPADTTAYLDDRAVRFESWGQALVTLGAAEPPLDPHYSHEACGFHWHGRDGMDIPMRDGEPICPRCELERLTANSAATEEPAP